MRKSFHALAFAVCLPFVLSFALAQAPAPPPDAPGAGPAAAPPDKKDAPKEDAKPSPYKKYEDVITKEAVSQTGLFKVHRIDDRVYWEIPAKLLGRLMLWQTEVAELPQSVQGGYPGAAAGTRTIRFTRRGTKLFMRDVQFGIRTYTEGGIKTGVDANSVEPVLMGFDIQTEGDEKNPDGKSLVVDVTGLFTSDPQDFAVKGIVGGGGVDPSRSYIDRVKAFPTNIETRSSLTFMSSGPVSSAVTATIHYSLDLLPETPMMGRLKDSRIGYFTQGFVEYGRPEGRAVPREFINRFRLEKKDPTAADSEPVKPILYYISREVPEKWRPYIKQAIEDWQPAFEKAGFKFAILAKDAPTKKEDPDWDPEDARYSVIRWAPSDTENAMGPSIQDPRSGETISAHVIVWNDIERLLEDWYFAQCAAIDPRARQIPFSTELMGSLIRYVVVHEVGHTLGLEHNFKASAWYPVQSLRDAKFTKENGMSASIMDYSRFNYVAQPGDTGVATIGHIGAYDHFAIEYGYKPIEGAKTPDDEKPALDGILGRQVGNPWVRFGNYRYNQDPTVQTEDIGNDPVAASRYGLLNLDRIGKNILLPATSKFGEDYTHLGEKRDALLNQRFTELFHVLRLVGGVVETDFHSGRGGQVFRPTPADKQRQAVQFLMSTGMQTPGGLFDPEILNRVAPNGGFDELSSMQSIFFATLLSEGRLKRLIDNEVQNGAKAYTVEKLTTDVFAGAWPEMALPKPKIDIYHRTMQRAFLKTVDGRINGSSATRTDFKLYAKAELRKLAHQIDAAIPKAGDTITALHLKESRSDIEKILADKYTKSGGMMGFSLMDLFGINAKDVAKGQEFRCMSLASRLPREVLDEVRAELGSN